jgi:hypothetical protein
MLQLLVLVCLVPQAGVSDPRDDRINEFLKRSDVEAWEQSLWNNPGRTVSLNDIMMVYKKRYNLDIAVNYRAFGGDRKQLSVDQPVRKIAARDKIIPRGLALQLYLDSYVKELTYFVQGGIIWIVPGKSVLPDESASSELGNILRTTKPKYDNELNKEATNKIHIPPTDLGGVLSFFANEDRGNFRFFVRERGLPTGFLSSRVRVPLYNDSSYDAILKNILDQVGAKYIVNSNSVVILPK